MYIKRYGYDPRIFHTKYLEDDGSIYGVDFLKKKERVQTKWIYLKKGQKVFFKVFDMTDKDANKRKLEAGIRDFSNNIKYVNRSEEIDYKFSIEKSGKYQCFVSNYNDQNIELLGEIEILEITEDIYNEKVFYISFRNDNVNAYSINVKADDEVR